MRPINLVVADDQELVRAGLRALLTGSDEFDVVGEASNGEEAVRATRTLAPDVVLMDVRMPVLNGIEAARQILGNPACQSTRVVMLTTFGHDEYVFGALRAGACGFVLKDAPPDQLRDAIRAAVRGDALLSPPITRRLVEVFATAPPPEAVPESDLPELTARELDVLVLVAQGLSNDQIAARLFIGPATVKTYVGRLFAKLAVSTRVHLVIRAYESGLVGRPG